MENNIKVNQLIVGLDLSFNSTGITFVELIDRNAVSIEFHRLIFGSTKPKKIKNINQHNYVLPSNINYRSLTIAGEYDDEFIVADNETPPNDPFSPDFYGLDQMYVSIKTMINCSRITLLIQKKINQILESGCNFKDLEIIFNIEGNVLDSNPKAGTQLRVVGGLIGLNQEVRSSIIKLMVKNPEFKKFKLFITSPTELKSYFSNHGTADKQMMLDSFINSWNGKKLLPDTSSLIKINDVVDSFALAMNAYTKIFFTDEYVKWRQSIEEEKIIRKIKRKEKLKVAREKTKNDIVSKIKEEKANDKQLVNITDLLMQDSLKNL